MAHQEYETNPFEIPMNNPKFMKIGHTRHDFGELRSLMSKKDDRKERKLTNCKRFCCGFDLAYCITLPLDIHSVRMQE